MPYEEDGETWDVNYKQYLEGMAENKPGHKNFDTYSLPKWVKHPLTHPFSGMFVDVKDYAYACVSGALDGLDNFHGWGPAHIACMYGDLDMLASCTEAELSAQNANGETPAYTAIRYGYPWALLQLIERGADTTTGAIDGYTPEQLIFINNRNHVPEIESLEAAFKGELTEKKMKQAVEYKLKRWRAEGLDNLAEEFLDKNKFKQQWYMYKTGDYKMPYELPTPEECKAKQDLPRSSVPRPPAKSKPALPAALLFPGQGSQYVGMLKDVMTIPAVKDMLATAEKVLGMDMKEVMLKGPEDKLSETRICQPAMFIAGMAAVEAMKEGPKKEAAERPQCVAGLSLGEYTAICAAGVLEFEECLKLVKARADAMQAATEAVPQAMCSVAGLDRPKLETLCKETKEAFPNMKDPVIQVANVLFPAGFTLAGNKECVDKLCQLATKARALQARPIKTGGAFHTPLMKPAQEELNKALDKALPKMKPPRCAIYFNITGKKVAAGTPPAEFIDYMKKQMTNEVLWEPTIKQMIMDQVKDFYECGPLKQIKSMIKRIDQDAFKRTENISV